MLDFINLILNMSRTFLAIYIAYKLTGLVVNTFKSIVNLIKETKEV